MTEFLLMIIAWILAGLIIYLAERDSRRNHNA
jgi:hypothetical protein